MLDRGEAASKSTRGAPATFPAFKKGQYGSSRSLVRMLATVLPIPPKYEIKTINQDTIVRSLEKDFNDDDGDGSEFTFETGLQELWEEPVVDDLNTSLVEQTSPKGDVKPNQQEAMQKIASLEAELSKLRTQIANYALNHVDLSDEQQQQDYTSAPSSSITPAPPPAPPPVPPLPTLTSQQEQQGEEQEGAVLHAHQLETPKSNPSFLSEINSVRLKSVARSPGGTPLRTRQRDPRTPDTSDPAAIIARALQKKFSHLIFQDSPNTITPTGTQDDDFSPISSPSYN